MQPFVNSNTEWPINFDVFSNQFVKRSYNPVNILILIMQRVVTTVRFSITGLEKKICALTQW
jgi:hypothetical protein